MATPTSPHPHQKLTRKTRFQLTPIDEDSDDENGNENNNENKTASSSTLESDGTPKPFKKFFLTNEG